MNHHQLHLLPDTAGAAPSLGPDGASRYECIGQHQASATMVAAAFDPVRLTQARHLAEMTKRGLAEKVGVSPAAVGQWEAGVAAPRPDHLSTLADALEVPVGFFAAGRRYARVDVADAHFRSLRATPAALRAKAVAFIEQVWELTHALERRVQLPPVDLPGFSAGEVQPGRFAEDPAAAARMLRGHWGLGQAPIPHLVNTLEQHGVIVTLLPFAKAQTKTIDAFSTSHLPRPVIALTPDRADDVYRHRFTAAHELGHLMLHADTAPGDAVHERQADAFAAEFLTPASVIEPQLPTRMKLHELDDLSQTWGVGIDSLIYRCHEIGVISEATYRRAFQRLNQMRGAGLFPHDSVEHHAGERPALLARAYEVAEENGLRLTDLASELKLTLPRLHELLGRQNSRPVLRAV